MICKLQGKRKWGEIVLLQYTYYLGFPGGVVVKNLPANAGDARDVDVSSWVGKIPWRRAWQPTSVFLPGKFQDRGVWRVHGVTKSQIRLSTHTHTHTHTHYLVGTTCSCLSFLDFFFKGKKRAKKIELKPYIHVANNTCAFQKK